MILWRNDMRTNSPEFPFRAGDHADIRTNQTQKNMPLFLSFCFTSEWKEVLLLASSVHRIMQLRRI